MKLSKLFYEIHVEVKRIKKKEHKLHEYDSVYESKIDPEEIKDFSSTINEHGSRQRTVSNLFEGDSHKETLAKLSKQLKRSQRKGELHYYPDGPINIDTNFDSTITDDDSRSINSIMMSKYHESLWINTHQNLIKYNYNANGANIRDFDIWEPKGLLVSTIYNYSPTINAIKGIDVSVDSEYWVTISNRKIMKNFLI